MIRIRLPHTNCLAFAMMIFFGTSFADQSGASRGAINNLCQNLTQACTQGDKSSCKALQEVGCNCNAQSGTCSRGNYSKQ